MREKNPIKGAKNAPRRTVTIRFRVTEDEAEAIQVAAAEDGAELDAELRKRGLAGGSLAHLRNPGEWSREIVLAAATQKLLDRKITLPWHRELVADAKEKARIGYEALRRELEAERRKLHTKSLQKEMRRGG